MIINGLKFVETCMACPEQYDVFKDKKQVAYIRLRWGILRVDIPDCGGRVIYKKTFNDGWKGCFDDEKERDKYLNKIAKLLTPKRARERGIKI